MESIGYNNTITNSPCMNHVQNVQMKYLATIISSSSIYANEVPCNYHQQYQVREQQKGQKFNTSNMDPELHNAASEGMHQVFFNNSVNGEESEVLNEQYFLELTAEGDNILHLSTRQGRSEFVSVALRQLPTSVLLICQKNNKGENPLHVAAKCGQLPIANLIVGAYRAYQQDVNAARRRSDLLALTLAEEGVPTEPWRATDSSGQTPLHMALIEGHEELATYLLEEDPELACYDNDRDESPLYLAASFGHQNFAHKILTSSIDYSFKGPGRATPLHAAVCSVSAANIVQLLLHKHPELTRKADSNKETALHHAAKTDQVGIVEMIVRAESCFDLENAQGATASLGKEGSSANQRDATGLTPLLKAATMGLVEVVITILNHRPTSIAICDSNGRSALHLIRLKNYHEGSLLFSFQSIQRLANEPDRDGNTPLHTSMIRKDHVMAKLLLDTLNTQLDVKNREGLTPRDIIKAQQELSDDMVEIGYQLMMRERQGQTLPEPTNIHRAAVLTQVPERIPEAFQERTPIEVRTRILEDARKNQQQTFNTLSVISSVLAAVTFAAILATPGGFNSSGDLRLEGKVVFKAFLLSNASAMFGYVLVLFCMLWATRITQNGDEPRLILSFSIHLLQLSFYATLAAFATASYALVSANSFWLAVVLVCIPGCVIVLTLPKFLLLRLANMLLRFHV